MEDFLEATKYFIADLQLITKEDVLSSLYNEDIDNYFHLTFFHVLNENNYQCLQYIESII